MKWKRGKKSIVEAKEASKVKAESEKANKGQGEHEKVKTEVKDKRELVESPQEALQDHKDSCLDSSLEADENMDSGEIIDVGGRPLVAEAGIKNPLVDQSNLHRDLPDDLSRLGPAMTAQHPQHPINARM